MPFLLFLSYLYVSSREDFAGCRVSLSVFSLAFSVEFPDRSLAGCRSGTSRIDIAELLNGVDAPCTVPEWRGMRGSMKDADRLPPSPGAFPVPSTLTWR
jgi:hypothetical protein